MVTQTVTQTVTQRHRKRYRQNILQRRPSFGDFAEVTEECNGNTVTSSGSGNKTVTPQLVENEGLMENCNYVTKNYNPLHKKEEDENIYREVKKPVTSLHGCLIFQNPSCLSESACATSGSLRTPSRHCRWCRPVTSASLRG